MMTRQDPTYRGPEEGKDAPFKASTAKIDWPCYKNTMSDYQRKFSMENFRRESTPKMATTLNAIKAPKPS